MTRAEFENALAVRGITVCTRAGELRYLAPPSAWTAELRDAAAQHREWLLGMAAAADAALDREVDAEYRRAVARQGVGPANRKAA